MKKILSLVSLVLFSVYSFGQIINKESLGSLKPTENMFLFNVEVMDINKNPKSGDKISFVDTLSGKIYSGVSNKEGKFQVLIPKGICVKAYANFMGKDSLQRIINVPKGKGLGTFTYTLMYQMPKEVTLDNVYFDTNKSTLKPLSFNMLNKVAEFIKYKPTIILEVCGYTDNVGSSESNMKLSEKRAQAVANYLISKGVPSKCLVSKGYGEARPIDTNNTAIGRQHNRRIELHVLQEN